MNVELFIYLKQYLLGMFEVSHLVEEATRHEKWPQLNDPFIFLSFSVPRFYGFFFQHLRSTLFLFIKLFSRLPRKQAKHIS